MTTHLTTVFSAHAFDHGLPGPMTQDGRRHEDMEQMGDTSGAFAPGKY